MRLVGVRQHSSGGLITVVAAVLLIVGCSSSEKPAPTASREAAPPVTTAEAAPPSASSNAGVSPGGVTTTVSVLPSSTQSEFYHACDSALIWMQAQQGDLRAQVEPYLQMVQTSPTGERGTWGKPWAQLSPQQQSAVILAVTTAANGSC